MKNEIKSYNLLLKYIDPISKFPIIYQNTWTRLREDIDTNTLKRIFVDYFVEENIDFPLPDKGQVHCFNAFDYIEKVNFSKELDWNIQNWKVYEPVNNKYSFNDYPLFLMKFDAKHNFASDYFHRLNRFKYTTNSCKPAFEIWRNKKLLFSAIKYIFSDANLQNRTLNKRIFCDMMRRTANPPKMQSPMLSKLIYDMTQSRLILDLFPQWGDRLCGFYASEYGQQYYTFHEDKEFYEIYKKQCIYYENWLTGNDPKFYENDLFFEIKGKKYVRIYKYDVTKFDFDILNKNFDIMFTENLRLDYRDIYGYDKLMKNTVYDMIKKIKKYVLLVVYDAHNYDRYKASLDVGIKAEDDIIDYMKNNGYSFLGKAGQETNKLVSVARKFPETVGVSNVKFIRPISFFHKDKNYKICQNEAYKNF